MNQSKQENPAATHLQYWMDSTDQDTQNKLNQGLTGYLFMREAFQSIAARIHLIRKAKLSLDLQYYIWADDFIGRLVLYEILKAADRGVNIRLLLDDQNGIKLDKQLKALITHPKIQIKIYNPYKFRHLRILDYIFRLSKINRRMHNKLIIADGAIAVTGGRNISSEYFDASQSFQFTDMDILFYGTAVQHANVVFLEFWKHDLSHDIQKIVGTTGFQCLIDLREKYQELEKNNHFTDEKVDQEQKELANQLKQNRLSWAYAEFLADSPDKTLAQAKDHQLISHQIRNIMGEPTREMDLIAAYFVPAQNGTNHIMQFPRQNIQVRILTNSFIANDVALVHAFYQKYRVDLLKSGAKIYEFKPYIERKSRTWYEVMTGNVIPKKGKNKSSLHAKFINIDDHVFIGSFNLDPRSFNLNTEVGLVVNSSDLQTQISNLLNDTLLTVAYELKLNAQDEIIWFDHRQNGEIIEYYVDPESSRFQRFMMKVAALFPIEWMM